MFVFTLPLKSYREKEMNYVIRNACGTSECPRCFDAIELMLFSLQTINHNNKVSVLLPIKYRCEYTQSLVYILRVILF
jgi:hypothetical protein